MQFHELAFSYISLLAVTRACMQFLSILCLSSSQEFRSACSYQHCCGSRSTTQNIVCQKIGEDLKRKSIIDKVNWPFKNLDHCLHLTLPCPCPVTMLTSRWPGGWPPGMTPSSQTPSGGVRWPRVTWGPRVRCRDSRCQENTSGILIPEPQLPSHLLHS